MRVRLPFVPITFLKSKYLTIFIICRNFKWILKWTLKSFWKRSGLYCTKLFQSWVNERDQYNVKIDFMMWFSENFYARIFGILTIGGTSETEKPAPPILLIPKKSKDFCIKILHKRNQNSWNWTFWGKSETGKSGRSGSRSHDHSFTLVLGDEHSTNWVILPY